VSQSKFAGARPGGGGYSHAPGGIVAAKPAFDKGELADGAGRDHFFRLGADDGADALRTDLHDAARLLLRFDHGDAFGAVCDMGFSQ